MGRRKKKRVFFCILVLLVVIAAMFCFFLFHRGKAKTGGFLTFNAKRCLCDADIKHTHLLTSFRYDASTKLITIEYACEYCLTTVALVEVSSYPANICGSVALNDEPDSIMVDIAMNQYIGNEPRIFDEIRVMSGYNNAANIVYENSRKSVPVLVLYEYSDWSATVIDALGVFTADSYKITFEPNGGTGIMNPKYFISGELPVCHYMKEGFLFDGWALSMDGEKVFSDQQYVELSDNVTLFTCWVKNPYELSISSENDAYGTGKLLYLYGREAAISATPFNGYVFRGWYNENNELVSDEPYFVFHLPEHDVYYTARFEPRSSMVHVIDGGTGYRGDYMDCLAGSTILINAGSKVGYEFAEWKVSRGDAILSDPTDAVTSFLMPEGDVVLTATWREIKGISADVNNYFTSIYGGSDCFNGTSYDVDRGITVTSGMIAVYIEYMNGSRRQVDNFVMAPVTLSKIGANNIPITLTANGSSYQTEIVIQCHSSSLYKLMEAAGVDADSFQEILILISKIQSGLLYAQSSIGIYTEQLDDLYIAYEQGMDSESITAKLGAIYLNMDSLASQLTSYESDISSVSFQTRALISTYKGVNSQAISDAFTALASQIKSLTEQILYTCDTQQHLIELYDRVKTVITNKEGPQ